MDLRLLTIIDPPISNGMQIAEIRTARRSARTKES